MAAIETPPIDFARLQEAVDEAKKGEHQEPSNDDELEALAELVPDLKTRKTSMEHIGGMLGQESSKTGEDSGAAHAHLGSRLDNMQLLNDAVPDERAAAIAKQENFLQGELDDSSDEDFDSPEGNDGYYGNDVNKDETGSDQALSSDHSKPRAPGESAEDMGLGGDFQNISSAQSLSTATQTHEVRMPMYLPTFKPATGCTNASDFIVRCFVARLRSGITVVKHGRSRWCKSRLRILHIHPDGRSLSWKPALGEPASSRRPPKLDLTTCLEVRHAWSPDPQNPMYTGTPILRQKCEAANAHKSFALIFPKRTVDITSVTADQCKVLMEGFSALCFRLQVANLAGKGHKVSGQKMPDEEEAATTASVTLTNTSTPISPHNRR
jgi:hypothetical protein